MTPPPRIAVAATGLANLASVLAGLRRAGAEPFATDSPAEFLAASHAVLPGVGAFGPAARRLAETGLGDAVRARVAANRPLLCICLGMQLLGHRSEESPGAEGLGIVNAECARFAPGPRIPQLGWNRVAAPGGARFLRTGAAYFANSYRIAQPPAGAACARTDYGGGFVSAFERGALLACQFHPELAGEWGLALLRRWIDASPGAPPSIADWPGPAGGAIARRVIPCLDCRDGRVVKGVQFRDLRDAGNPAELAAAYEAQGADEIVLLDVAATPDGRRTALDTVRRVRERIAIPLSVGGGVRTAADARALLEAGADKVGVNSAAVADPALVEAIASQFGAQCAVVAIDAAADGAGSWKVVVNGGRTRTEIDAVAWSREAAARGAGEILLTSLDRDGTRAGYHCDLLRAVSGAVAVPVIASGGADSPAHLADALDAGADAVLAASIFHSGQYAVSSVKNVLAARGYEVRR